MQASSRICLMVTMLAGMLLTLSDCWAADPTLARLTFWVASGRQAEFGTAFDQRMLPVLKQHGLIESQEKGRPTVENAFTRMFEADSPAEVLRIQSVLARDANWNAIVADLEQAFRPTRDKGWRREPFLKVYRAPFGSGRKLQVGPGRRRHLKHGVGPWHTVPTQGRIPGTYVGPILQTNDGTMWFGSDAGITRFDGSNYETFTTKDGLASNHVKCITEDREGNIWIGTSVWWFYDRGGGVSRFDGEQWITYTESDGLAGNNVDAILQDAAGMMWFGTEKGLSRLDPESGAWHTFTTDDGLPHNMVRAIIQDRDGDLWIGCGSTYWHEGAIGGVSRYDGGDFVTYKQVSDQIHDVSDRIHDVSDRIQMQTHGIFLKLRNLLFYMN